MEEIQINETIEETTKDTAENVDTLEIEENLKVEFGTLEEDLSEENTEEKIDTEEETIEVEEVDPTSIEAFYALAMQKLELEEKDLSELTEEEKQQVEEIAKSLQQEYLKDSYLKQLDNVYSQKLYEVRKLLLQREPTEELLYEYSRKEAIAKEAVATGDYSILEDDAKERGLDVKDYANIILEKAKTLHYAEDKALLAFGRARSELEDLLAKGDIETLEEKLQMYSLYDVSELIKEGK
ncbi:MAG: hypothetical protein GXO02_05105 [Epsilonproteobacteria bacterium]|nr:hypothetical protein [Campylobacterota bacterium]